MQLAVLVQRVLVVAEVETERLEKMATLAEKELVVLFGLQIIKMDVLLAVAEAVVLALEALEVTEVTVVPVVKLQSLLVLSMRPVPMVLLELAVALAEPVVLVVLAEEVLKLVVVQKHLVAVAVLAALHSLEI